MPVNQMLMKFQNIKLLPIRVALFTLLVASALLFTASAAFAQAASGITVPAGGSSVSGDVIIQGTAVIEPFQNWPTSASQTAMMPMPTLMAEPHRLSMVHWVSGAPAHWSRASIACACAW